jgi:RsiW-degrading membrane proteinase PrsW (M82 family)
MIQRAAEEMAHTQNLHLMQTHEQLKQQVFFLQQQLALHSDWSNSVQNNNSVTERSNNVIYYIFLIMRNILLYA